MNGLEGRKFSWQEILALVALLGLIVTGAKTWFWNEWRIDELEKDHVEWTVEFKRHAKTVAELASDVRVIREIMQERGVHLPSEPHDR